MFDEKKPPTTWPICDITIKSALGHVLHAMLLNKTNLPENNICSALHTILKSYDNCHGFCKKEFETIVVQRGAVVQWLARPLVTPAARVRAPDQAHY